MLLAINGCSVPKPAANMRQEGGARGFWTWLGLDSPADRVKARPVVSAASRIARQPALYGPGRIDDTFTGRFEAMTLFGSLLQRRMDGEPNAKTLAQAVSNRLFSSFDEALREAGEGDLSVAKRMKSLARAYLGRLQAYDAALAARDKAALTVALSRNIWNADEAAFAPSLASYAGAVDQALAGLSLEDLADPAKWPAFNA